MTTSFCAAAGGPHLDESLKMGAPGLDFQTWDSVDTRPAKELGIEVSHPSESRHGPPNILSIRIGLRKRRSRLVCFSIDGKSPESLIDMRSPEILSSAQITANANHNRDRHEDLDDHEHSIGRTAHPVSHPHRQQKPQKNTSNARNKHDLRPI